MERDDVPLLDHAVTIGDSRARTVAGDGNVCGGRGFATQPHGLCSIILLIHSNASSVRQRLGYGPTHRRIQRRIDPVPRDPVIGSVIDIGVKALQRSRPADVNVLTRGKGLTTVGRLQYQARQTLVGTLVCKDDHALRHTAFVRHDQRIDERLVVDGRKDQIEAILNG